VSARKPSGSSSRLARFGVVVVLVFMTAVLAGVARAEDGVVVEDVATTTPSDPTSSDTGVSTDPATDTTGTQDPAGSTTDPSTSPSETPTDTSAPTDSTADNTGTDPTSPPPGDTVEPTVPGDTSGESGSETPVLTDPPLPTEAPPVTDPVPPATDDPPVVVIDDGTTEQPPATPSFGVEGVNDTGLLLDVQTAAPGGLDLFKISGAATTKGRDARLSDDGARSTKEQSARRSLPSGGSPASSPSSAASGASGAGSSSGGGVALAVEFLLAALLVLHYTRRASFTLPDSLAFALREERPG
jgi:uncharacterized membrane protein YgcG